MATVTVTSVLKKVQIVLQDTTGTRWPLPELLGWFNLAQKDIVNHRPDTHTKSILFDCQLGTRQVLPPEALRLIRITRNETAASKRVVKLIDQRILDDQIPDWHDDEKASLVIDHYVYDDRIPKEFMVFPAAAVGAKLRGAICTAPLEVVIADNEFETDVQVLGLDDTYVNPIMDFILYRAYSKDVTYAGSGQNAIAAYQSYANALGIKAQMDQAITPKPDQVN
ncbi:DUF6682 family protein [Pseudoalteromonas sp. ASV78]|uniref:phage adaptor protein n=1 Tax=Pseudoalteromonas sp. ASV78 TaxID=3397851 RepID=UPI0039FD1D4A